MKKNIPILFLWNDILSILKHRECEHKWKWPINYKIAPFKKNVKKYKLQNQLLSVTFPISNTDHHLCSHQCKKPGYQPWSLPLLNRHKNQAPNIFFLKNLKSLPTTTALLHLLPRLLLLWYLSMVSLLAILFFFKSIIKKSCQNDLLKRKCWHQQLTLNISTAPHPLEQ